MPVRWATILRMFSAIKFLNLTARPHFGLNHLWLWPLIVILTACSTLEPAPTADLQADSGAEPTTLEPAMEPELETEPGPGLTADLLYDLLVTNLALQQGELNLAAEAVIRAARSTGDPVLISQAVRMAVQNKNYTEAVELGQRWIELAPKDYQAGIITALAAVMDQQAGLATDILSTVMAQSESKLGLRFGQLGEMFLQYAQGDTAQLVLSQLAGEYPDSVEAWLVLAGMAQKNQDFAGMNSALDRLLLLEPGNEKAAGYKLLALSGNLSAQTEFATTFLKDYPGASDFRMQYARLLLRTENQELALSQLLSLLRRDSKNSEAINLVALLYQAQEDYKKAAKYFARKIKVNPHDDRSRLFLAHALQEIERYDEAKTILAEVSDADELFAARRQMFLLIEQADGAEAALSYMQTLQGVSETQAVQLLIDREQLLQRAGRSEEAHALINDALEQNPDNDTLRYHRALILVEQNDFQGHESDMRILLSHKPDNAHYNNTLGYSLLGLPGRLDEAAELINKAHQLEPDDPYILDSKGWLEYKLGNLDVALEYLNKAFFLDQDAEIAAHVGEVYWAQGDREKAREFWAEGDRIDPTNKALQDIKARFLN